MRLISGMILGFALTVGGVYVRDTMASGPDGSAARPMVNWDVVSESTRGTASWIGTQWNKLVSK